MRLYPTFYDWLSRQSYQLNLIDLCWIEWTLNPKFSFDNGISFALNRIQTSNRRNSDDSVAQQLNLIQLNRYNVIK